MADLLATEPAEGVDTDLHAPNGVIRLAPVQISGIAKQLYSYTGYLVLGKEIIEYDAIKYQYTPRGGGTVVHKWISKEADIQSNQALAEPSTFAPMGQYRIKQRNAFGVVESTDTLSLAHSSKTDSLLNDWSGGKLDTGTGVFTPINPPPI